MAKIDVSIKKQKKRLFFFEYPQVPVLDDAGNTVGYKSCPAFLSTVENSAKSRLKRFPNELGLSADPANVQGFKATLDLINQNRNLRGRVMIGCGSDDVSELCEIENRVNKLNAFIGNEN